MIKEFEKLPADDLDKIADIWLKSNLSAHHFIDASYWLEDNYAYVKEAFLTADIYLYYYENEIVGFLGIIDHYIAGIFLLEEFQSLGIGTQLLKKVQSEYTKLGLHVYEKNSHAVQFYLKNEFIIQKKALDINTNEIELFRLFVK